MADVAGTTPLLSNSVDKRGRDVERVDLPRRRRPEPRRHRAAKGHRGGNPTPDRHLAVQGVPEPAETFKPQGTAQRPRRLGTAKLDVTVHCAVASPPGPGRRVRTISIEAIAAGRETLSRIRTDGPGRLVTRKDRETLHTVLPIRRPRAVDPTPERQRQRSRSHPIADNPRGIRLPGAGLIFSSVNGRKWTEPPGKLLHDEVVPAQICRHRGVGLCGCEGVGNEGHEGRLAGRRTCAEHVAVESAHGRLAVPLSPRQLVSASSAATVGPGGSLAGRWVWRLPRRIPVPHGGARPRGSRRWRAAANEDTRRGPTPRTAASCLVAFPPLAAKPTGRGLGRRRDGAD